MLTPDLFPDSARFCYVRTDDTESDLLNYDHLHPLEQSLVSHSVEVRKAEFGDARWCAHQALAELGYSGQDPILRGERGMPLWPKGFVGSMSHTTGLRAAVAAPETFVRSMGIDVEPAEPLPEGVLPQVARSGEMAQLDRLREQGYECADRILFCAKEATYKAWFPMTHRWLGFEQAEIDIRDDGSIISYLLVRPTPVPFITGRWVVAEDYVVVATSVPQHPGIEL